MTRVESHPVEPPESETASCSSPAPVPFLLMAQQAGITPRVLNHWVRRGYVAPEGRPVAKSGIPRSFGPDEARIVITTARLVRAGFRPERAAEIARIVGQVRAGRLMLPNDEVGIRIYLAWSIDQS